MDGHKTSQKAVDDIEALNLILGDLGKSFNQQKQILNYHMNTLNQFVENGYEVYKEEIQLKEWWLEKNAVKNYKIFFNKDYSSRPQLFYTISALKNFKVTENDTKSITRVINLSVTQKEIMTSYFTVEIKIEANGISTTDDILNYIPVLEISYLILNNQSKSEVK